MNPHGLLRQILSLVRLPISPLSQAILKRGASTSRQAQFTLRPELSEPDEATKAQRFSILGQERRAKLCQLLLRRTSVAGAKACGEFITCW